MNNYMLWITLLMVMTVGCSKNQKNSGSCKAEVGDTVIDAAGRTVILPDKVVRVVSPFTMYTRLVVALGGCEKLAGISHTCLLPEEMMGCSGSLNDLPDVGPFGANIELITSLAPDVIFSSKKDVKTFSEKTNAKVVAVSFDKNVPMLEMFDRQIDIVGKTLRLENQADSLKDFIKRMMLPVTSVTETLPENKKPRVYFAWTSWTGDILNTVCEFDPIEIAGGINVARGSENYPKGERGILVTREHIIKWNPDIIFVSRYQPQKWRSVGASTSLMVTIEDVMNDPLLQSVSAVKNKKVYYTTAFCNWWPHQRALVQILYMARLFYPKIFEKIDIEKNGNEIFKRFYGVDGLYTQMALELDLKTWR